MNGELIVVPLMCSNQGQVPDVPVHAAEPTATFWLALLPVAAVCRAIVAEFCCDRKSAALPFVPTVPVHWDVQPAVTVPGEY